MSESKIRKKLAENGGETEYKTTRLGHLSNRPFLIVTAINRVAKGVDTSKPGWAAHPDAWEVFEQARVEDRINNKTMAEAAVIIDIMRGQCVKHRFEKTDDEVTDHYLGKYMEICKRGLDIWLSRQAQKHLLPIAPKTEKPEPQT